MTVCEVAGSFRRNCALPTSILIGSIPGTLFRTRVRLLTQPPHDMPLMVKVLSVWDIFANSSFYWIPLPPICQDRSCKLKLTSCQLSQEFPSDVVSLQFLN